jgi:hypothetical protein
MFFHVSSVMEYLCRHLQHLQFPIWDYIHAEPAGALAPRYRRHTTHIAITVQRITMFIDNCDRKPWNLYPEF